MKVILGSVLALTLAGSALAQPPAAPAPGGAPAAPRPRAPVAPAVPINLALEAARAAVASCTGLNIGVVIVDQSGAIKLSYLPDGTSGFHSGMDLRKALTALLIKAQSEDITARVAADPDIAAKYNANKMTYSPNAGGLPIMSKSGVLLGAVGVSGAEPSAKDKACAVDGLKAIQDRLN